MTFFRLLLLAVLLAAPGWCPAQAPAFAWAQRLYNPQVPKNSNWLATIRHSAVDDAGNLYVLGEFNHGIQFAGISWVIPKHEKSALDSHSPPNASKFNVFLAKYNPAGQLQWAQQMHDTWPTAMAVSHEGHVYLASQFSSTVVLGPDTLKAQSIYEQQYALVTYDGNGTLRQARVIATDSNSSQGYDILHLCLDAAGNAYATGTVRGSVHFGAHVVSSLPATEQMTSPQTAFVVKVDPNGRPLWVRQNQGLNTQAAEVAVDASGNVYASGTYHGTTVLDGRTLPAGSVKDDQMLSSTIYLAKYSPAGTLLWAQSVDGLHQEARGGLAVDETGQVYLACDFLNDTLRIGGIRVPGPGMYLAKFASTGALCWARRVGQDTAGVGNGVAVDGRGYPYFYGSTTIPLAASIGQGQAGKPVPQKNSPTTWNVFVARYSPEGVPDWWQQSTGTYSIASGGFAVDRTGAAYFSGMFRETVRFGAARLKPASDRTLFLVKLAAQSVPPPVSTDTVPAPRK